jgi:GDP-4-dehydro-6-deoxy-D-mannose reductase
VKTALITGAGGFFAAHLAEVLAERERCRVVGVDLRPGLRLSRRFDNYVVADVANKDQADDAIQRVQPDWVFHLAGQNCGPACDMYRSNLITGVQLLESLRRYRADARVVMTGSAAEYGPVQIDAPIREEHSCNPVGAYGLSKYALTLASLDIARREGMKIAVARPFNLIGPGVPPSLVIGAVLERLKTALASPGEAVVKIGNLDTRRDFLAVQDAARAYWELIRGEHWGEVFNICSGVPTAIRTVLDMLLSYSPRRVHLVSDPALARPIDAAVVYGSYEKANGAFGFVPSTPLNAVLHSTWLHFAASER